MKVDFHFKIIISFLFLGMSSLGFSQKIDVDSLLVSALQDTKDKKYDVSLEKSRLGIKLAPDYLDFYLLAGRNFQMKNERDSALFYYNYVIDKNPVYEDAFAYQINMDLEEKKYEEAVLLVEKALVHHPENKSFKFKKLAVLQETQKEKEEYKYLKILQTQYPEDDRINQRIFFLDTKNNSDRIGLNYSFTTFSRDNYGPWHLAGLNYIRERKWGSLIGRINYADRLSAGESIANGIQYEAESYFFTGKKSYSYAGLAYSDDTVFPKLRLGYSYFQNFNNGWEGDLGFRFTKAADREFKTGVIGIGKYFGSFWLNLRTFIQNEKEEYYPAFTFTTRYYFNTRFDYATLIAGYGTSPDERTTLGQFDQRVALDSYRLGLGYYRLFNNHFVTGIQTTFNQQEYAPDLKQHEFEISLQLQYKF